LCRPRRKKNASGRHARTVLPTQPLQRPDNVQEDRIVRQSWFETRHDCSRTEGAELNYRPHGLPPKPYRMIVVSKKSAKRRASCACATRASATLLPDQNEWVLEAQRNRRGRPNDRCDQENGWPRVWRARAGVFEGTFGTNLVSNPALLTDGLAWKET